MPQIRKIPPSPRGFIININERSLSESYDPVGIESGDDEAGCCHWSEESAAGSQTYNNIPEYGRPAAIFDDDTKPHEIG